MSIILTEADDALLKRYSRAIAHMRWQLGVKRFGIIFGAGASQPLGFPSWDKLVERVAKCPEVDGAQLIAEVRKPLPIIAEVAFYGFRTRQLEELSKVSANANDVERLVTARWVDLIHRCLYQDVPSSTADLMARDKVYTPLLSVVKESPMTVNYNYDDSLQRLLLYTRGAGEVARGFETVTDLNLQHSPQNGVLYHPNGFLPRNHLERITDKLIFNDGAYAGQMVDFMAGAFSSLLHNLSKHTWLLVGLSLTDETLRHLLHRSALLNPGHYHYHIEYCEQPVGELSEAMRGQAAANFETYNLITLFLTSDDIAALGRCVTAKIGDLRARAEEKQVRLTYTYYFTGVPAVGKTTALAHFKNCATWDEWLEERLPEMSKPFVELTDDERAKVDSWILRQVGLKNRRLLDAERESGVGITVVDRAVPDAVSFTQPEQWSEKARALLAAISPGAADRTVHPGHVILLLGDPKEVKIRAATKNRSTPEKYTSGLQDALKTVYGETGVTHLDATNMTVRQVVKEIARIIHLREYVECDMHGRLLSIGDGSVTSPERIELS